MQMEHVVAVRDVLRSGITQSQPAAVIEFNATASIDRMLHACMFTYCAGMPHTRVSLRVQCRDRSSKKKRCQGLDFGTLQMMRRMHACMVRNTSGHMGAGSASERAARRPLGSSRTTSWPAGSLRACMAQCRRCDATSAKRYAGMSEPAAGGGDVVAGGWRRGRCRCRCRPGQAARPARRHEVKLLLSGWGQGPAWATRLRGAERDRSSGISASA